MIHKLTKLTTRVLAILFAICATGGAWADTLRVLGSDATICSSATTLDQLGFSVSDYTVSGTINFYTPDGCTAGDKLLFTKLEMLKATSTPNPATTITITVNGKSYTSGNFIETSAPSSLGNLTTAGINNCNLYTYNFPNVEVAAGQSYTVSFNMGNNNNLRYRMENTASGAVFTSPASSNWRPYAVVTVTKVLSSSPDVGDTILISNTATDGSADASATSKDFFSLSIPTDLGLLNGSVIKVTKVNLAGRNNSYSSNQDPYGIYVNGVRSLNLRGTTTYANSEATALSLNNATVQVGASTSAPRLSYAFGSDCNLTVGTSYDAATTSNYSTSGKGVSLLHANGTPIISNSKEVAAVRHVSASSGVIVNGNVSGDYPVYEMYAEVVSIPAQEETISESGTKTLAEIFGSVPPSGRYTINVNETATLNIDAETTVANLTLNVASGKTLTLTGSALTVSNGLRVIGDGCVDLTSGSISGIVRGDGTVVYSGKTPVRDLGWTESTWTGTVWVKNISNATGSSDGIQFNTIGNSDSKVKVSGITGWLEAPVTVIPEVILDDDTYGYAWKVSNGNSPQSADYASGANVNRATTFRKLSGAGTLLNDEKGPDVWPMIVVNDPSDFSGAINIGGNTGTKFEVAFIGANETFEGASYFDYFYGRENSIYISPASSVTIAASKTWTATGGMVVKGTLTLAGAGSTISGTVTGSGTVVCNQVDLSGSGFDNASGWTGKVQIVGGADVGSATTCDETSYGNANSTLEVISGHVAVTAATSLPGTVNVASDATLYMTNDSLTELSISGTNSGIINLAGALNLTTLTLSDGIARGTVVYPSSLTTLNLTLNENLADDIKVPFNVGSATLESATVTISKPDGTANTTAAVALSDDKHTANVTYTPTVDGSAAWCAYEFTSNLNNTGSEKTALSPDGSFNATTSVDGDGKLYTYSHPYRSITYPDDGNWSVMVRCTVPKLADAIVVDFGTTSGHIGLIAGENPDKEMRVVQCIGNTHYLTNAVMPVLNGTTAQHVYVFTVEGNQHVKVYCDNTLISSVDYATQFTIGNGIQVGSVHGNVGSNQGLVRFYQGDGATSSLSDEDFRAARIDSMRIYKVTLGENAIAQLSEEFPAVQLFEATISGGNDNVWGSLAWTGGNISSINAYSKAIITVENDATLTLPASIEADELVFTIASGKKLTLKKAVGGSTLAINHPIEANAGAIAFEDGADINFAIGGTGSVFVDSGKTINVVSGGSLTTLSGSGMVVYSALPTSALSFGTWTGTVQIPAITTGEINLNNYGIDGSTVKVMGISGGAWLTNQLLAPTIELGGDVTLSGFSTSFPNTFQKLTGSYQFSLTYSSSLTDDAYKGYFLIKDVSEFTGSFAVASPGLVLGGTDRPNKTDWYGKVVVQGEMKPPTTTNNVVATSTAVLDYTSENGTTSPITGDLYVVDGAQFKFPAGATFPFKVADSISGATSIPAASYTVGGVDGTVVLALGRNGQVCPATDTVEFDGTTSTAWSGFNWGYTGITDVNKAIYSLNVTGTGTISGNLTAGKVTIDVAAGQTLTLSGTLTADEIIVNGSGTVVCSAAGTLQGTIKGASTVTISYPDHTLPSGAIWTDTAWQGTLVLNKCGHLATEPAGARERVPFENYGNASSKIRAPGFKGFAAVANASSAENSLCEATLVLEAGDVFEFNHGFGGGDKYPENSNAGYKFKTLSGSGKLILDGTTDYAQYIFCDVSGFSGDVLITFPGEGGRKSYLFGAPQDWSIEGSAFPANLVIAENASVSVAAGKTWDIPAGTIIDTGATLSMGNNSTNTVLSSRSTGTLAVPSGSATVTNIMGSVITAKLNIGSGATLNITDDSLTTLTVPADAPASAEDTVWTYKNAGRLDLSGCENLETLYLVLGDSTTVDFDKIVLPSDCKTVYLNIGAKRDLTGYVLPTVVGVEFIYYAEETASEYANGGFEVTSVPGGAPLKLKRRSEMEIDTDLKDGTTRYYNGGRSFAGAACWHEWDFEVSTNRLVDTGMYSDEVVDDPPGTPISLLTDSTPAYSTVKAQGRSETFNVISSACNPYAVVTFGTTWSAAVRCTMPSVTEGKKVGIAFGDTTNGILGLASRADGMVDLFNWTSADGGTYTALAQFMVEKATTDMHIYVFTVKDGYVSLYRDGEFIHTATFTTSGITQFKVGGVIGSGLNLPEAATDGYVDYVRLYDKVLPESDIEGLSLRRPFVSAIDSFERTVGVIDTWSEAGTWKWTKANGAGVENVREPNITNANVTVSFAGPTTLGLNIGYDIKYGTLKFEGDDTISLTQDGTGKIGAAMLVVRADAKLTVDYDAVDFSDSTVGVDADATLTFNLDGFPFASITTNSTFTLIGYVPEVANGLESAKTRYGIAVPASLPANIASVTDTWVGGSYKVIVNTTHQAGVDQVYYKTGDITGEMDVYLDDAVSGDTVRVIAGDNVYVNSNATGNDVSVYASFSGNLVVSRTALNITPAGEGAVLDGRTITVADGCTVTFKSGEYGALTLVKSGDGTGKFVFEGDVSVASLSGDVGITVADGATLTLGLVETFVTGGVEGTGTVVLPVIATGVNFNFDAYGNPTNTVALTSFSGTIQATVTTTLRLDGSVTITSEAKAYSFAKITGDSSITFTNAAEPNSVTIGEVANTVSITNNSVIDVEIGVLSLAEDVAFGAKMLTKTGKVVVSGVSVGGEPSDIVPAYAADGVYKAVAQYSTLGYRTLAEAIAVAGATYLSDIVVLDPNADLAGDYQIIDGTTVATKPTAYTWIGGASGQWSAVTNWQYDGDKTASRLPNSGDTATFFSDATVTISSDLAIEFVDSINCGTHIQFELDEGAPDVELTVPMVLADVGATITLGSGITLSATPTTDVPYYEVNEETVEGNKVYSLVKKPGTIFSVY